ncbi:MAG: hypothetical protein Q9195_009122 [Heterodermia aff. obscurata]
MEAESEKFKEKNKSVYYKNDSTLREGKKCVSVPRGTKIRGEYYPADVGGEIRNIPFPRKKGYSDTESAQAQHRRSHETQSRREHRIGHDHINHERSSNIQRKGSNRRTGQRVTRRRVEVSPDSISSEISGQRQPSTSPPVTDNFVRNAFHAHADERDLVDGSGYEARYEQEPPPAGNAFEGPSTLQVDPHHLDGGNLRNNVENLEDEFEGDEELERRSLDPAPVTSNFMHLPQFQLGTHHAPIDEQQDFARIPEDPFEVEAEDDEERYLRDLPLSATVTNTTLPVVTTAQVVLSIVKARAALSVNMAETALAAAIATHVLPAVMEAFFHHPYAVHRHPLCRHVAVPYDVEMTHMSIATTSATIALPVIKVKVLPIRMTRAALTSTIATTALPAGMRALSHHPYAARSRRLPRQPALTYDIEVRYMRMKTTFVKMAHPAV